MLSLERRANRYKPTGLDCQVLTPSEIQELHPFLYTEDIQGGVWVPEDATVHPKKVSVSLKCAILCRIYHFSAPTKTFRLMKKV